jgi:hypothetical protein
MTLKVSNLTLARTVFFLLVVAEFSAFDSSFRSGCAALSYCLLVTAVARSFVINRQYSVFSLNSFGHLLVALSVVSAFWHSWIDFGEVSFAFRLAFKFALAFLYITFIRRNRITFADVASPISVVCCVYGVLGWSLQYVSSPILLVNDTYSGRAIGKIFFYMAGYGVDGLALGYRNQGFFSEPGLFAVPAMYLYYTALTENKLRSKVGVLAVSSLVTAASSASLLAICVLHVLQVRNSLIRKLLVTAGIGVCFVLLAYLQTSWTVLLDQGALSTLARLFDAVKFIEAISQSPALGYGLNPDNYKAFTGALSSQMVAGVDEQFFGLDRGQSNSIFKVVLTFGIPIGALHLYSYLRAFRSNRRGVIAMVMIVLASQPVALTLPILIIQFGSLVRGYQKREN